MGMADAVGIKSFGAYVPRMRLMRAAAAAAHGWAFPRCAGLQRARAPLLTGTRTASRWGSRQRGMRSLLVTVRKSMRCCSPRLPCLSATAAMPVLPHSRSTCRRPCARWISTGSLRAGTSAMLTALCTSKPQNTLVIAAEARKTKPASAQELRYGDAAAAVIVGSKDLIAVFRGAASLNADFVDHYRAQGQQHDYVWEERWARDEGYLKLVPAAIRRLCADMGLTAGEIDRLIVPLALPGVAEGVARAIGVRADALVPQLLDECGDAGAAYPILLFAHALEVARPGQKIVVVGFGNGCDALLFEATGHIGSCNPRRGVERAIKRGVEIADYVKFLALRDEIDLDWGMRSEFTNKIALSTEVSAQPGDARLHRWPMHPYRHRAIPEIPCERES